MERTYPEKPYCSFSFFGTQQPKSFQFFLLVSQRFVLLFPAPDSDGDVILHPLRAHQSCPLLVPWWVRSALHEWQPSSLVVGNRRAHKRGFGGSYGVPFSSRLVVRRRWLVMSRVWSYGRGDKCVVFRGGYVYPWRDGAGNVRVALSVVVFDNGGGGGRVAHAVAGKRLAALGHFWHGGAVVRCVAIATCKCVSG